MILRSMRAWVAAVLLALSASAGAQEIALPPTCAEDPAPLDETTPLAELRSRAEALAETDPSAVVRLLCATIPRVAREHGADSVEYAWWIGSLATPLIAYLDRHAEALPLLERARGILEARLGPDDVSLADIHVAHAWIAFRQGRLADAQGSWRSVLRIRELHPGLRKIELQKALVGLAQVQVARREFAAARATLDRAYAILEENDDTVSEAAAAIHNTYTNLALREEDYPTARRHAETQIEIERQLSGGAPQLVPAFVLLGRILERLDEFEQGEAALREAVRLAESEQGPLQRHHLAALTQLASLLHTRGRPDEALPFGRRALDVGETTLGPEAPWLVRVLSVLAEIERSLGRLPEALHLFERAGTILERHPSDVERPVVVGHLCGLGLLELDLGDVDRATATLGAALAAAGDDPTLSTERARALLALAEAASRARATSERAPLEEALALFRARLPESHPTILHVRNALCRVDVDRRAPASSDCDEVTRRIEATPEAEPGLRRAVLDNLSRLASLRGDSDTAYTFALRALSAASTLGTPDPLWRAYIRLANLLGDRGDPDLAIFFGKRSILEIERLRSSFRGEDRRFDRPFLADKVAVYRTVADWLLEAGRIDEGLEVLRLLKSEELYDFALRDGARGDDGPGVALSPEEEALAARLEVALETDAKSGEEIDRLTRLREAGRLSVREREQLDTLLLGRGRAESERVERIRRFIASRPPVQTASTTAARASKNAPPDPARFGESRAVAYYVLADDHLRILVAAGGQWSEVQTPVDGRAVRREIGTLLDRIGDRTDVMDELRALFDLLARPVDEAARRAHADRLVLWLDGPLRYVPFAALHDGERYLGESYVIETHTAASASSRPAIATRASAWSVRGLGTTRAVAGYSALPSVADELCSIVRGPIAGLAATGPSCAAPARGNGALHGEGFADDAFTEARFRALLGGDPGFAVLHLGTHFSLRPGNALRSFLVLGDGSKLTLDALAQLDFHGIELLTLSACQTGLGGATTGDGGEIDGLSALVQRRGARRVVSSLWQVEDASTALLMKAMYRALTERGDAGRALARAQSVLRDHRRDGTRPYTHPYYWAGFVVSTPGE